jgi:hypothetical protein
LTKLRLLWNGRLICDAVIDVDIAADGGGSVGGTNIDVGRE